MNKYLVLLLVPLFTSANEQDIQKLISERTQLESLTSELQSEIRSSASETDRTNEKILILQDELKETKRKLTEAKTKRAHFLTEAGSKKGTMQIELNRQQLLAGIADYENFVKAGLPWDIDQRMEKIKTIKTSLQTSKNVTIESVLQWSQFLEAERKLASETQHKLRRLAIEGVEQDAAIFRMGLTTLYYKTANGQTGIYYRKNQRLFHQQISEESIKNIIAHLVESKDSKNTDRLLSELVLTPGMVN
jgi:hypothetical protein